MSNAKEERIFLNRKWCVEVYGHDPTAGKSSSAALSSTRSPTHSFCGWRLKTWGKQIKGTERREGNTRKNPNGHWQGNEWNYFWIKCQSDSSLRGQMAPQGPAPADRATAALWEQGKSLITQSVHQPIGQTANTGHGDPQCGWAAPSTAFTFCPLLVFHSQPFSAQPRPHSSSSPAWSPVRALATPELGAAALGWALGSAVRPHLLPPAPSALQQTGFHPHALRDEVKSYLAPEPLSPFGGNCWNFGRLLLCPGVNM